MISVIDLIEYPSEIQIFMVLSHNYCIIVFVMGFLMDKLIN